MSDPLRIANCSGFYGDRAEAAREMVEGGPIDVLTGDWLAELTMLILSKDLQRRPEGGYARTFISQMRDVLPTCAERGIQIVANAGGLNPAGCAEAIKEMARSAGVDISVAWVTGDDLLGRLDELRESGHRLVNADTGEDLDALGVEPLTANAYLGGWAIAEALGRGADVVITGRVTDAAVVVGPAAWRFGWSRDDWDRLAGAVVAGHVIECGTQATGGNYAFFEQVPGLEYPGFPIAEMYEDGSSVITKHPGTGGLVSAGTITAQLLYEIQGPHYMNPDAVVDMSSIRLTDQGQDRVQISGVRGLPGPEQVKVAVNSQGGWRNSMTFVLTGLDIEAKAHLAERTLWSLIPGGRESFDHAEVRLVRHDRADPATNEEALALLTVTVTDTDPDKTGRAFSQKVIEMLLGSYPGMFTTSPPSEASTFGIYWPVLLPSSVPHCEVVMPSGERFSVEPPPTGQALPEPEPTSPATSRDWSTEPTTQMPLGRLIGARSGDKGGNANIGLWALSEQAYDWLGWYMSAQRLRELMPTETAGLDVERHALPNLRAFNFVITGLLGRGVAATTRTDPQAKGLGEYLRAKYVPVPERLAR